MSATATRKKPENTTINIALNDEEWNVLMSKSGLRVIDCYARFAGPCEAMQSIFKRLKTQHGDHLHFNQAESDEINELKAWRNKSCPHFLFYYDNVLVQVVKGANAPLVETVIKEILASAASGQQPKAYDTEDVPEQTNNAPVAIAETTPVEETAGLKSGNSTHTFAIIKPDGMGKSRLDQIIEMIRLNRFEIVEKRKVWLNNNLVSQMYPDLVEKPYFEAVCNYMTAAPVLCMILAKENAIEGWRKLIGPTSSIQAKESAPDSRINAVFGADDENQVLSLKSLLFSSNVTNLPFSTDSSYGQQKTLLLLKPDVIAAGKVDNLLDRIICKGFQVIKREELLLTKDQVKELYSKYKNEYFFNGMVDYLSSAPTIAMVVTGECVIAEMLEMLGPHDPLVAKESCPMSIRALFGTDRLQNACHTSETVEDATHEINLLFPHSNMFESQSMAELSPSTKEAINNAHLERTLALIKPDAYPRFKNEILKKVLDNGFTIVKEMEVQLSLGQAQEFYKEHQDKPFFNELTAWMSRSVIYALCLEKSSAVNSWRELCGPTNSAKAKEVAPNSIRAIYGTDESQNAVHGSDSPDSAEREIKIVFGASFQTDPEKIQATLALIKPDVYPSKKIEIIDKIRETGFKIALEKEVQFSLDDAKQFYKEHEGKPFFDTLCSWMSSSPIYAMVLEKAQGVTEWRKLAGPTNSEKARTDAPNSIRALYGKDGSSNAVHGSDSLTSAEREIKLVFGTNEWDDINKRLYLLTNTNTGKMSKAPSKANLSRANTADLKKTSSMTNQVKKSSANLKSSKANIANSSKTDLSKSRSVSKLSKSNSKDNMAKTSKDNLVKSGSKILQNPKSRTSSNAKIADAVP